jgi:hypothetical protein
VESIESGVFEGFVLYDKCVGIPYTCTLLVIGSEANLNRGADTFKHNRRSSAL